MPPRFKNSAASKCPIDDRRAAYDSNHDTNKRVHAAVQLTSGTHGQHAKRPLLTPPPVRRRAFCVQVAVVESSRCPRRAASKDRPSGHSGKPRRLLTEFAAPLSLRLLSYGCWCVDLLDSAGGRRVLVSGLRPRLVTAVYIVSQGCQCAARCCCGAGGNTPTAV